MQPLVGNNSVATSIFAVVFGGWILFEILFTKDRLPDRRARGRDRRSGLLIFLSMFTAFVIMQTVAAEVPSAAIGAEAWAIFTLGIVIALAGFALRLWAIRVLGHSFTTTISTRAGQTVVCFGPYRFIRHPAYAGPVLTVLGAALTFTNWLSLLAIVPVFAAYSYRIWVEEAVLRRDLGAEYVDYCRRTKRLIPFLY